MENQENTPENTNANENQLTLAERVTALETKVKTYGGMNKGTVVEKEAALQELQEIRQERKSLEKEVEALKKGSKISDIEGTLSTGLKKQQTKEQILQETGEVLGARLERKALEDKLVALKKGTQTSDIKKLKDELKGLEKEGAKALEKVQQDLFEKIITQATLAQVNKKLGVEVQQSTRDIVKDVAEKYMVEEGLKNSLTVAQNNELDKTLEVLKKGKVDGKDDVIKTFFEEVDREVGKNVNKQTIQENLKEMCNQPSYKNLDATVELKQGKNGLEWKVKSGLDGKLKGTVNRLQEDLNTQLTIDDKLKDANKSFLDAVNRQIEETQKSSTLQDMFNNIINRIKQFLGMDVKLEQPILGKFTKMLNAEDSKPQSLVIA